MKRWNFLETIFFAAFLFWSVAGLTFTIDQISPAIIAQWHLSGELRHFIGFCLKTGDPILIILAFANTHFHAARQWTPAIARQWGLLVLVVSFGVEALGVRTGFPFGVYHYTDRFGPMLGGVPITIPFAWHIVVTNALFVVRNMAPYLSRLAEAACAALLCTLYDFVLEPFATTVKHYWDWSGGTVPPLNYVAWFVISVVLIRLFAPTLSVRFRLDLRPWLILGLTLLIFVAGGAFSGSQADKKEDTARFHGTVPSQRLS